MRLVSAEFLKLRRRTGLKLAVVSLTVAPVLIAFGVTAGESGGMESFVPAMGMLGAMSIVAAMLVGATVGTGDVSSGVFRDLVMTGRSRLDLFAARVPAGLALLLPMVGAGFLIVAVGSTVLAGSLESRIVHGTVELGSVAPSAELLVRSAGWLALVTAVSFALALGVSSLIGSRGTSIAILLAWWLVAMPLLMGLGSLGSLRAGLVVPALEEVMPGGMREGAPAVPMSIAAAIAVVLAWTAVPLLAGAWRTVTRDA